MLSPEYIILILLHEDDTKIGAIVATIAQGLSERRKQANITDFFVLPKYRKLKGADFLYTQFEKELANLEVFSVKVSCEIKSTLNQNFYASKGFKFDKKLYLKNF